MSGAILHSFYEINMVFIYVEPYDGFFKKYFKNDLTLISKETGKSVAYITVKKNYYFLFFIIIFFFYFFIFSFLFFFFYFLFFIFLFFIFYFLFFYFFIFYFFIFKGESCNCFSCLCSKNYWFGC